MEFYPVLEMLQKSRILYFTLLATVSAIQSICKKKVSLNYVINSLRSLKIIVTIKQEQHNDDKSTSKINTKVSAGVGEILKTIEAKCLKVTPSRILCSKLNLAS